MISARKQRRTGAQAVEFALISIPLFILIMGIIEVGRAFMVQQLINNAARVAARTASIGSNDYNAIGNSMITPLSSGYITTTEFTPIIAVTDLSSNTNQFTLSNYSSTTQTWGSTPSPGNATWTTPTTGYTIQITVQAQYSKISWIGSLLWPFTQKPTMSGYATSIHE